MGRKQHMRCTLRLQRKKNYLYAAVIFPNEGPEMVSETKTVQYENLLEFVKFQLKKSNNYQRCTKRD